MSHLSTGQLRAHLDHELSAAERAAAEAHLATCGHCREERDTLARRAQDVGGLVAALSTEGGAATVPPIERWRAAVATPRAVPHSRPALSPPAWAAIAAGVLLLVSLSLPPVRAIAVGILDLFRVQRIAIAPVNPGNLPERLGSSTELTKLLSDQAKITSHGERQLVASPAAAATAAGYAVRAPAALGAPTEIAVEPGVDAAIQLDLARIRAVLREIDAGAIDIPDEVDGKTLRFAIPPITRMAWGACPDEDEHDRRESKSSPPSEENGPPIPDCTVLIQAPSPEVSAPPGLPIAELGEAFLQVLGMPEEEAARFSRTVDWSTTLVVPIPRYSTSTQEITVDGVPGTLIHYASEGDHASLVLWLKNGIIHALMHPGAAAEALRIADSLR